MNAPRRAPPDGEAVFRARVLRESIRERCTLTQPSLVGLAVIAMAVAISLSEDVAPTQVALWILPLLLTVAWRVNVAHRELAQLDTASAERLPVLDRELTQAGTLDQAAAGAGIWSVAHGASHEVALFVTLAITLYAVAAMISLTSSERAFRAVVPFSMGQAAIYWLVEGGHGWGIAATAALISALMLALVRRSSANFTQSLRMLTANEALLEEVRNERNRVEEALNGARAASRAKSRFLVAASHDLRQPLYAISLLADTMALQQRDQDGIELVQCQRQAIDTLSAQFDNLLDLSRFEEGKIVPAPVAMPLAAILDPLAAQHAAIAAAKSLAWQYESPAGSVRADPALTQRLLGNLLSNAVRFTERGGIGFGARAAGDRVEVWVSDTGPGIALADQPRVFEEFTQLPARRGEHDRGLGLGLAIARRISRIIDARLRLESERGRGCRFSISLPLVSDCACALPRPAVAPPPAMRVWATEDDPLVAKALARQFDAWQLDYRILAAPHEIKALIEGGEATPDAAVLDDLPMRNDRGREFERWLAGRLAPERILIVGGHLGRARQARIERAGFEFIRKPVGSAQLAGWLARHGKTGEPASTN